ncbi:hypothetical protein [Alteraurantiacibacter aquimixticola]|uniref:Uncharacterized protein n=1 Tax=Alteraurantiacibacter aquimixticola TaxID=2489173 RepID=A0A4T3EZF2_9SPHN|nr:hypothetical protein [Alteraurantiacibacter aquimixticola]TIX50004.1 hypothetical protein E5222_06795 [Alteraurantiacibacter aquimixticola]
MQRAAYFPRVNLQTTHRSTLSALVISPKPADGTGQSRILGRYVIERQVEFAAACGAGAIVIEGGGTPEAIAARLRAEELGLTVREISGPHGLERALNGAGHLLVLGEGVLPTQAAWTARAGGEGEIITFPAGVGVDAGLERIDLDRAWAGALLMPAQLARRLDDLPEDSETASALLRIALQARVYEKRLHEQFLADGTWQVVRDGSSARRVEEAWLSRHSRAPARSPLSRRIAAGILRRVGRTVLARPRLIPAILGTGLALAAGGLAASFQGLAAVSFAALAGSVLLVELFLALRKLKLIPREPSFHWRKSLWLLDIFILASAIIASDGSWIERVFPAFVLLAALHATTGPKPSWRDLLRDRMLATGLVALLAAVSTLQTGLMLTAAALLLLNLPYFAKARD